MRRTAVAAGTIVAALAAGGGLAVSGGAQAPGGRTIQLVTKDYVAKTIDAPPRTYRDSFGSGDRHVSSGRVFNAAGARRGSFDIDCAVTRGGDLGRVICDGAYALAEGHIFVRMSFSALSAAKDEPVIEGAVAGGTRAYSGARGTFTSRERPGSDDDAMDDVITLLP